jgi:precorrin-6Y C5,15-methyltransferase (decarboxylating)
VVAVTVTVVGLDGRPLAPPALDALQAARWVSGWPRHAELVAEHLPPGVEVTVIDRDLPATLDALAAAPRPAVVLASGDPGYFGVVRAVRARVGAATVVPAVSSVAAAFAAARYAWDDAHVVSAHSRPAHRAVAVCRRFPKVAVLTEPAFGPAELGRELRGLGKVFLVAERLGHDDEGVTRCTAEDAAQHSWRDPNVVVVLSEDVLDEEKGWSAPPRATATRWALPEDAFDHRAGMITKAEVRALALAWLGPGVGDLVWDVGAGSGSVAVEAARLGAAAIAVDGDAGACERVRTNALRHGVPVQIVHGHAPGCLAELPDPDAVFVGGGGTDADVIVAVAAIRARRAVVVTLATLERLAPVTAALEAAELEVNASLLQGARLAPLADGHRLAATNQIFVVGGLRA